MGFVPDSMLTTARRPEITRAFGALAQAARTGTVTPQLKEMIALVASSAGSVPLLPGPYRVERGESRQPGG